MALHRDIYWIGRQWAVTGFGIQAVDQRLQGAFDIETGEVWDDRLAARVRAHGWVNGEDFDKALTIARQRFPQSAGKALPLVESVLQLMQEPARPAASLPPSLPPVELAGSPVAEPRLPTQTPQSGASPPFRLHMQGKLARFLPQWRVKR